MPADDQATPGVWPIVRYSGPFDAKRWLCDVLGFQDVSVSVDKHDVVVFEQLGWPGGGGVLLVHTHPLTAAAAPPSEVGASATHLVSPEVDAIYQRVLASGVEVLSPPTLSHFGGWPHGSVFTARDPGGNLWTIGTHQGAF